MKATGLIQFIKFGVVGVSNTAVDWVVYYIFNHFILVGTSGELPSKAISFVVAVINSYIWNTIWTFRSEYKNATAGKGGKAVKGSSIFLKFVVISLIGWVVNYYTFKYTRMNLSQGQIVSLVAASGAATLWNFFGNKLWTYRK